jgi:hypothetical protein
MVCLLQNRQHSVTRLPSAQGAPLHAWCSSRPSPRQQCVCQAPYLPSHERGQTIRCHNQAHGENLRDSLRIRFLIQVVRSPSNFDRGFRGNFVFGILFGVVDINAPEGHKTMASTLPSTYIIHFFFT